MFAQTIEVTLYSNSVCQKYIFFIHESCISQVANEIISKEPRK